MSTLGIFKHIFERKEGALSGMFQEKQGRVDEDLPFNLKINSMIKINESKFIINGDALKIASPGGGNQTVIAVEKFKIGELKVYRFYLEGNDSKAQSILQDNVDKGEVTGIRLYRIIDEVYPAGEDDWDVWLNSENGLIGYKDFRITNEDGTETYYRRFWGGDGEYTDPIRFDSTVIFDPYGASGMKTRSRGMVYGRDVTDSLQEYLFIVQESLLNDDGEIKEAKIELMAGIDLEQAELEIFA